MGLISFLLLLVGSSALILAILPLSDKQAVAIARIVSCLALALTGVLVYDFDPNAEGFQFLEKVYWVADLSISYEVGLDGISIFMLPLTALSACVILLTAVPSVRQKGFCSLFLFLELSLLGVFCALDLVLFFVCFELMLLPSFLLINGWGGQKDFELENNGRGLVEISMKADEKRRASAGLRFVLYTALGSALMLCSIVYLAWISYSQTGQMSFSLQEISSEVNLDIETQACLFLGFFIAFAVKTPFVPFHFWLPAAYRQAPSSLTAFLSAVMAKAGLYGMIRFNWQLFPSALKQGVDSFLQSSLIADTWFVKLIFFVGGFDYFLLLLLVFGALHSALVAWSQHNAKTLLAYSSVSHLALCGMAIILCSVDSLSAAVFFMIAHGLVALGLFLTLREVGLRTGSLEIVDLGGLAERLPRLSTLFFIFLLATIALPLSANFVAEFLVLLAVYKFSPLLALVLSLTVVLSALYMLSCFRRSFWGKESSALSRENDIGFSRCCVYSLLLILIFGLGIWPSAVLKYIRPAAERIQARVDDINVQEAEDRKYDSNAEGYVIDSVVLDLDLKPVFCTTGLIHSQGV